METVTYRIVTRGEIAAGFSLQEVKDNIAGLCKYDQTKLERVFSGERFVFKRNVDLETTRRYKIALDKTGIISEIELEEHGNQIIAAAVQKNSQNLRIKFLLVILVAVMILGGGYYVLPTHYKDEMIDTVKRQTAPNFIHALDLFDSEDQADIIREFKGRGYSLNCYGGLRHEEKITKDNDYVCWAPIKSAYTNIPARWVAFGFTKGKLSNVRLEFPDSSHDELMKYLGSKLGNMQRVDNLPQFNFGTDSFGAPLMVWNGRTGYVTTSAKATSGQSVIVLWSSGQAIHCEQEIEQAARGLCQDSSSGKFSNSVPELDSSPSGTTPGGR